MDSENSTKKHVSEYQYFADSDELFNLGIAEKGENIINVFERVVDSLTEIELRYENSEFAERFRNYLLEIMKDRKFIPSTTILMNAGRINSAPLSACAVPQVDLKQDLTKIKKTIDQFHFNGMGTGFNFDDVQNPIEIIKYLNKELTKEKAVEDWINKEVQYAKRQLTFMKKDKNIKWIEI